MKFTLIFFPASESIFHLSRIQINNGNSVMFGRVRMDSCHLYVKTVESLTKFAFFKKKCYFVCKLRKRAYLCNRSTILRENMNVTNSINLAVLRIIRVVVVTSRGEEGCMPY